MKLLLTSALLVVIRMSVVDGHLYFQCPSPRTCFYGGYWGSDKNGPWTKTPCDRVATTDSPTATMVAGDSICLKVYEFVDHIGYYRVAIQYGGIVNRGDADPGASWTVLADNVIDVSPSTGNQVFTVTLPANQTCDRCTIQVRQWSDDQDMTYYACADVRVITRAQAGQEGVLESACAHDPSTCLWEERPQGVRIYFYQTIGVALYFIIIGALVITAVVLASKKVAEGTIGHRLRTMDLRSGAPRLIILATIGIALGGGAGLAFGLIGAKSCLF
mmetsp:Transcript_72103/g.188978  ORF Transcript_72103/g.188978 Transcript_72103/m.188978 type:complete len:274 (+) Transcript_72103:110-931(+)